LSLTPVEHGGDFSQLREMAGDLRLDLIQRMGQFTDTELPLAAHQHQYAQTGGVTQGFEKVIGFHYLFTLDGVMRDQVLSAYIPIDFHNGHARSRITKPHFNAKTQRRKEKI
jgi:hypothetical protein